MPSNEGNVTGNMRRILDDGTAATATGVAATDVAATQNAKLKSTLGPQLEPMIGIFALQPTELKDTLISKSKEILDIVTTIK